MSWHQDWDISNQPLLWSQRAVLSQLKCTQSVRNILRFQHPKMVPPQKMAEKILSILVWFTSCLSAAWACLKPFDWFWGKNKKAQNFACSQGHFLKALILPMIQASGLVLFGRLPGPTFFFFSFVFFGSRWVGCRLPEIPIQKSTGTGRSALDPLWPRLCLYWPASRYADGALGFPWFQAPREGESLIAVVVVVCCRIERHQVDKTVMIPDDLKRGDVDGIDLPPVLSNVCHVWIRLHIQHCVVHICNFTLVAPETW